MADELGSTVDGAFNQGLLVVDEEIRRKAMLKVVTDVEDPAEAALFMDMLGLIDALPGNEPVLDPKNKASREHAQRKREEKRRAKSDSTD